MINMNTPVENASAVYCLDKIKPTQVGDRIKCGLYGWVFFKNGGEADAEIMLGGKVLQPTNFRRMEREDLKNVYPDYTLGKPGFAIFFEFPAERIHEQLTVRFVQGEEKTETCIDTCLYDFRTEPELQYHVDDVYLWHSDEVRIQGWRLAYKAHSLAPAEVKMTLLNDKGEAVVYEREDRIRSDINKMFLQEHPDYESGFKLMCKFGDCLHYTLRLEFEGIVQEEEIDIEFLFVSIREHFRHYRSRWDMWRRGDEQLKKDSAFLIKKFGKEGYKDYVKARLAPTDPNYDKHRREQLITPALLREQKKIAAGFEKQPKISIVVPTYKTPKQFLIDMIESCRIQSYPNWELCIADGSEGDAVVEDILKKYHAKDPRVVYKINKKNLGIAGNTNAALEMATGDYIALLDHDDLLAGDALFEMVKIINAHEDADVLYSDEDKFSEDVEDRFEPAYKPDFNLDLFRANNYICHFFMARADIVKSTEGFRKTFDGSQDFDFIFQCIEKARAVYHVRKVLYLWRCHMGSVAMNPESKMYAYEAGRRAIEAHLERTGETGCKVEMIEGALGYYRTTYPVRDAAKVSVLILHDGTEKNLETCRQSIVKTAGYKDYDMITVIPEEGEDTAAALNRAAEKANGKYLVFTRSTMEILSEDWMPRMLGNVQRKEVGAVGAKTFYRDNTVEHCGYVLGLSGFAGLIMQGQPREAYGRFSKAIVQQNMSAVSGELLMVSKEDFRAVGGFDDSLKGYYYDVDFCLKLGQKKLLIVFDPNVQAYHYVSREDIPDTSDVESLKPENSGSPELEEAARVLKLRWKDLLEAGDPCYNPNWSRIHPDFSYRFKADKE
ncbi:MAG: glycosyltransferase [Eubacteriales bacterium]|nr:glycosyltransferase [Eubacteriales bacterium]